MPLGDCAAVRVGGVEVVLITKRTQALGLELFTNLGIDPRTEAGGGEVDQPFHGCVRADRQAGDLCRAAAPLNRNYRQIPYTRVNRPIWPLDEVTSPGLIL